MEHEKGAPEGHRHPASKYHLDVGGNPLKIHTKLLGHYCVSNLSMGKHNSITGMLMWDKAKSTLTKVSCFPVGPAWVTKVV